MQRFAIYCSLLALSVLTLAIPHGLAKQGSSRFGVARTFPAFPRLVLETGHGEGVSALAFSANGMVGISAGPDGTARSWVLPTGKAGPSFNHGAPIQAIAVSNDGRLATAGSDGRVCLWVLKTGAPLRTGIAFGQHLTSVAFSPDGRLVTAGAEEHGTVWVWDASSAKLRVSLAELKDHVTGVAFSPDGKWLAGAGRGRLAAVWAVKDFRLKSLLKGHSHWVTALKWFRNSQTLVTASYDGSARVWDVVNGQQRVATPNSEVGLTCVDLSPDGQVLATGGMDEVARTWDPTAGRLLCSFPGSANGITAVRFSPDGERLATAGLDGKVRLWNARAAGSAKPDMTLQEHRDEVMALAFSPDGARLLSGGRDRSARLWDSTTGRQLRVLGAPPPGQITATAPAPDGRRISTGSMDGTLRIWDSHTGALEFAYPELSTSLAGTVHSPISALAFSPDQSLIAVGRFGETLILDLATGKPTATLAEEVDWVRALVFSPDGGRLASVNDDLKVRLYARDDAKFLHKATAFASDLPGSCLAFSSDGNLLASGSRDGMVRLWDGMTLSSRGEPLRPKWINPIKAVAFTPDGRYLTCATGMNLETWDLVTGKSMLHQYFESFEPVRLDYSRDGTRLLGLGASGKVMVWNGNLALNLSQPGAVDWSAFSPASRRAYSVAGTALSIHSRSTGRVLATLMPMPDRREEDPYESRLRPRPIDVPDKGRTEAVSAWLTATPQGYYTCSVDASRYIRWNVGGAVSPVEQYQRRFYRPDLVIAALAEKRIPDPPAAALGKPPSLRLVSPDPAAPARVNAGEYLTLTFSATSDGPKHPEVELFLNDRPVSPDDTPAPTILSRPKEAPGKPIDIPDKGIKLDRRPIDIPDKPLKLAAKPPASLSGGWALRFRIKVPDYTERAYLRAVAYDAAGIGSLPVELEFKIEGANPRPGTLHVLSIGVSDYLNGSASPNGGISDLKYAAYDARCVARRFRMEQPREGTGALYTRVETQLLADRDATCNRIRSAFDRIQKSVDPAGIDSVLVYFSGHGLTHKNDYRFAAYETDLNNLEGTTFAGNELAQFLGGTLRARQVFVFIDTCRAGAIPLRTAQIVERMRDSVFVCASSGPDQSSHESDTWKHGAFTYALLQALDGPKELPRDLNLYYLMDRVREGLSDLMVSVGKHPKSQELHTYIPSGAVIAQSIPGAFRLIDQTP